MWTVSKGFSCKGNTGGEAEKANKRAKKRQGRREESNRAGKRSVENFAAQEEIEKRRSASNARLKKKGVGRPLH